MEKRGQGGEAVKYLLIAAAVIFVTFFGYSIVQKARDNSCNAEIAQFEISLKNLDKAAKYGSVKEFTEQVPCGADEIYFFGLSKGMNLDFLSHLPLLKDSVESKAEKNVFLVKDNKLMGSFYAGSLDIGFPNYICFLPKSGKINFFLEGKGTKAAVFSGCLQPECTYIPENASYEEVVMVLQEAKDYGQNNNCPNCPAYYETVSQHFYKFAQTRENANIFRKYEYCRETGKTNVEITIRPKGNAELKNFRYYESIPKNCIDGLQAYLSRVEGDVSIKNDPLMVWMLDEIKTEGKISYELDKLLPDECKKAITGLGVAEAIENGRFAAVPEMPVVVCGDGNMEGIEECDDSNNADGDGCSSDCHVEACANDCSLSQRRCGGSKRYQECVVNPKGCLMWSPSIGCPEGQNCENGNCVDDHGG